MNFTYDHPAQGIWRLTLRGPEPDRTLAKVLAAGDLKGVIVNCDGAEPTSAGELPRAISQATVPLVASIRGDCSGACLEIARACHFRVACRGARIDHLEAQAALERGLLDQVTEPDDLDAASLAFLDSLVAGRPPHLVRAIVESIHNAGRTGKAEALIQEAELFLQAARRSWAEDASGGRLG
jgi:enoyl-CoA hydratase/carnithine racemase